MPSPATNPDLAILAYDGLCSFEFGIAVEVFAQNLPPVEGWYRAEVCAAESGPMKAMGGVEVRAGSDLGFLERAGTVVVPGWRSSESQASDRLVQALRRAHENGARILSICSGVFPLAQAGLLDGRRATTHWRYSETLRATFPRIQVTRDVLFVDEGSVLTSAGSAAGIDLCLHLVRHDYGADHANALGRRLLVPPRREGGQAQYIPATSGSVGGDRFDRVVEGLKATLSEGHTVASMADLFAMSTRTLTRQFRQRLGCSPGQWLIRERVFAAQRLLETTRYQNRRIATLVGFRSELMMRRHFRATVGVTPGDYRKRFALDG